MFAGAVVADLVAADELLADRDLDGVTDDGDLDLAAAELRPDPVAGRRRSRRCRTSRPCGSRSPPTPSAAAVVRLPRTARVIPAGCLAGSCRRAWVATSTPRWWICTSPPSQTTSTFWPASHTPAL